ncbi:SPARC-related modular calcium-binding protein 1 isoform X3 [Lingula anatina]|uniref:SPARC-related modular calcium-binding protein 1 isoform X3 n=1 Tax=Lingula anatina TaxID=7574 RepID=A0A1S3HH14_LINAN|nr:SPARC-related modular calcium-binding protein 1 isoform X3 [Lingula anatina]|eukprot:XP_013385317.1 SPARC-related modular calcium-binding protein 1 isoform X3 [Lingula anatina]
MSSTRLHHWKHSLMMLVLVCGWIQGGFATIQKRSSCRADSCTDVRPRPVCGNDGRTYESRCELKRVKACEGRSDLEVRSKGECPDPNASKCMQERRTALKTVSEGTSRSGVYVPQCESDGSYAKVQCHEAARYCWCVNTLGKPIPNTSTAMGEKVVCRAMPNPTPSGGQKGCKAEEREEFNANLIKQFAEEYERIPRPQKSSSPLSGLATGGLPIKSDSDSILDTHEKRVTEWKFSELDRDKDNQLKSRETRNLRKMVKKLVKPRSCAKKFLKFCDTDNNKKISNQEWSICLGVDVNISFQLFLSLDSVGTRSKHQMTADGAAKEAPRSEPTLGKMQMHIPIRDRPGLSERKTDKEKEDRVKSCREERESAIQMDQNSPQDSIFIPSCTSEGKYDKAQCHTSVGYCWCVDQDTGRPIPGTSTHKVKPNCDNPWKGCDKKREFLVELLDDMTTEMVEYASGNKTDKSKLVSGNPNISLEERVARWKLRVLDRNNNMMLDRRELRKLKKEVRKKKSFKKCGRHFVEYCDADNNKKITVEEFLGCLGVNDQPKNNMPASAKRRGPNPFSKYLIGS